jgi:hypothetical protein
MKRRLFHWILVLTMSCLLSLVSGCDLTLGPKVKTMYVLIQAGRPVEILEKSSLKVRILSTGNEKVDPVVQDVGGWVAMPPEHWAAVERALKDLEARRAADKK